MTGRRWILSFVLIFTLSVQASAAPVQVIVQLKSNSLLGNVLNLLDGVLLDSIPEANIYLLKLPKLPIVSSLLGNLLGILWTEPNVGVVQPPSGRFGVLQTQSPAADWYKYQPAFQKVRAQQALAYSRGEGVVIADINGLVDYAHPALQGHLTGGSDFVSGRSYSAADLNQSSSSFLDQSSSSFLDQSSSNFLDQSSSSFLDDRMLAFADNPAYSHGTLTVGVIAAVAPAAMIMPVRAFDENGEADLFTLAKAIRYSAKNGADVINMSFDTMTDSKAIRNAIDYAKASGVILVASAGNNNTSSLQYPAAYSGVITVASTDLNDIKGSFSNYGSTIEVTAPGVNIISAYPQGYYAMVSGTSFSAPMVAGQAALIRSMRSSGITSSITSSSINIDWKNPAYARRLGSGRIDILRSIRGW